eukprot:107658-Chlamydomonas_euryale.AAC.16
MTAIQQPTQRHAEGRVWQWGASTPECLHEALHTVRFAHRLGQRARCALEQRVCQCVCQQRREVEEPPTQCVGADLRSVGGGRERASVRVCVGGGGWNTSWARQRQEVCMRACVHASVRSDI